MGLGSLGSTGTRTRWSKVEVTPENGETLDLKRLSDFAAIVKKDTGVVISAQDVSKAIFDEAGTTDPDQITYCSIEWSETDKDKNTHKWTVTVYRDPKNSTEEESEESDEDNDSE